MRRIEVLLSAILMLVTFSCSETEDLTVEPVDTDTFAISLDPNNPLLTELQSEFTFSSGRANTDWEIHWHNALLMESPKGQMCYL